MIKRTVAVLKYVISLGLAVLLLYLAFRNIDFAEFWEKAEKVDYTWVIFSIILSLFSYWARAYRWNILLKPLGYRHLSTYRTSLAVLVGYLANLAFPRLGEVTRCGMLKRSDDVPVSSSLGTVISERLIDMISLLLLIFFLLLVEYDRFVSFLADTFSGADTSDGMIWKAVLILAGIMIAFVLGFFLLFKRSLRVREFVRQLVEGILSLRKIDNLPGFIISTAVLWITYFFMSYVIVFSIPETSHLGVMAGIMILVTGGIALALPVQGGIGTYHAFVSSILVLYAVEKTTGVFLATLLHTSQLIAIAVFGGIGLLLSGFVKRRKSDETDKTEDTTA